ncbi:MAG: hypothetical protein JXQ73_01060 [Phycisphaerae bacterium]|nr:hypothetical protein [Phycisphaerae bacterium]
MSSPGPPFSEGEPGEDSPRARLRDLSRGVSKAMKEGDDARAARRVIRAEQGGLFQQRADVLRWLVKKIGKKRVGRLIDALARYACHYCQKGYAACDECHHSGESDGQTVCEKCMGLGAIPCDFCGGTHLIPLDALPAILRPLVAMERGRRSIKRLRRHMQCPLPDPDQEGASAARQGFTKELLAVERRVRGLRAALIVILESSRAQEDSEIRQRLGGIISDAARIAETSEARVRRCIHGLAVTAKAQAEAVARGSSQRRLAESKAAFCQTLAGSDSFAGTAFDRATLQSELDSFSEGA